MWRVYRCKCLYKRPISLYLDDTIMSLNEFFYEFVFCASHTLPIHKLFWTSRWNSGNACCRIITKPRSKLSGRSGGGAGKGRRACNYVSGIWIPPPVPLWLPVDRVVNQREAETSANVKKHWKTHARGNEVITNVMSANQHFASTFSMQIFKLQRRGWKLSFFFPPRRQSAPVSLLAGYFNV